MGAGWGGGGSEVVGYYDSSDVSRTAVQLLGK